MPFSVTCPSCSAKMKAPDSSAGKMVPCPKCHTKFPAIAPAEPVLKPELTPAVPRQRSAAPLAPAVVTTPIPRRPRERDDDDDDDARTVTNQIVINTPSRAANSLGITSLVLGVVGLCTCWLPVFGMVIPGVGLLLGLAGILLAVTRKGGGIGFGIGGSTICALAFGGCMWWTGGLMKVADKMAEKTKPAPVVAEQQDGKSPTTAPATNATEAGRVDASNAKAILADVATGVTYVKFSNQLEGDGDLEIGVEVANRSDRKKYNFDGWGVRQRFSSDAPPKLTDDIGNSYKFRYSSDRLKGQLQKSESLFPGKTLQDFILFERPVDKAKELYLDLPAKSLGSEGVIRFRIPISMVKKS